MEWVSYIHFLSKIFLFYFRVTICSVCLLLIGKEKRNKTKTKDGNIETCNHFTCPIEHFLNLVNICLQDNATSERITKESYSKLSERNKQPMLSFSSEIIDNKIIHSMPKRANIVIALKGQRIKY